MNIEFICVCYNFQRRLAWFLSSLVQQTLRPDITINIAYVRNNGKPTTEEIIEFYKKDGIKFRSLCVDSLDDIAYRGALRNAQIALSLSDWLYFYDIDQVLPPDYFEKWCKVLDKNDCIYNERQKIFTEPEATQKLIDISDCRWIIAAYKKANELPKLNQKYRTVASGGMILMRRELIYKVAKGLYSDSYIRKDRHILKQRTTSDPVFRAKFKVKSLALAPVIHLGHCSWSDYRTGHIIQQ